MVRVDAGWCGSVRVLTPTTVRVTLRSKIRENKQHRSKNSYVGDLNKSNVAQTLLNYILTKKPASLATREHHAHDHWFKNTILSTVSISKLFRDKPQQRICTSANLQVHTPRMLLLSYEPLHRLQHNSTITSANCCHSIETILWYEKVGPRHRVCKNAGKETPLLSH